MSEAATKTEVGSYFISNYPPFSQWRAENIGDLRSALAAPPADVPLGLYLHIPFCRKRCKFCYFKVFTDKNAPEVERYLAALSREIELVSQVPAMGDRPFRSSISAAALRPFSARSNCGGSWNAWKRTSAGTKPRKSRSSASPAPSANPRCMPCANSA